MTRNSPSFTRRAFTGAAAASAGLGLSGCAGRITANRGQIDARVDSAIGQMHSQIPGTKRLTDLSVGMLMMPQINEASFFGGAAYGEGALIIQGAKVDYYSMVGASIGLQLGAQRYKHALMFMTAEALAAFRAADGWELGVDAEYVVMDSAAAATMSTQTYNRPVYVVIFGQEGLALGVSLEGNKYSRIVR